MNLPILQDTDVTCLHEGEQKKKRKQTFSLSFSHNSVCDSNGCKSIHSKVKQFVLLKLLLCLCIKLFSMISCLSLKPWFAERCCLLCWLYLLSDLLDWRYLLIHKCIYTTRSTSEDRWIEFFSGCIRKPNNKCYAFKTSPKLLPVRNYWNWHLKLFCIRKLSS